MERLWLERMRWDEHPEHDIHTDNVIMLVLLIRMPHDDMEYSDQSVREVEQRWFDEVDDRESQGACASTIVTSML